MPELNSSKHLGGSEPAKPGQFQGVYWWVSNNTLGSRAGWVAEFGYYFQMH